jgi:hypothetical protein
MPIFRDNVHYNPGQYASNIGGNMYLAPAQQQSVKPSDFSNLGHTGQDLNYQQNYAATNPFLYPRIIPPLFKAKPFNDNPVVHIQSHSELSAAFNNDHRLSSNIGNSQSLNFNHVYPQNTDQPLPEQFNLSSDNLNYQQPPHTNELPINFNQQATQNFKYESIENFNHPPATSNINHLPVENINNPPSSQNFNYHSSDNSNHFSVNFNEPSPQNFGVQLSPNLDHQISPNSDYGRPPSLHNQSPFHYDDQHSTSNFEQHHEPSQIIKVIKEPPTDIENSEINNRQEPDHAESRPALVNSESSNLVKDSSAKETLKYFPDDLSQYTQSAVIPSPEAEEQHFRNSETVHFQRSPLIDLSVAGESTTKTPSHHVWREWSNHLQDKPSEAPVTVTPLKGKPINDNRESSTPSIVIDYILSSPEQEFDSSAIEKETRSPPPNPPQHQSEKTGVTPSVTTTTSPAKRTTAMPLNQRQQETLIESIVQSYEFFKTKNEMSASARESGGRLINDTDEYSASKEVTIPSKFENEKKNKQVSHLQYPLAVLIYYIYVTTLPSLSNSFVRSNFLIYRQFLNILYSIYYIISR